ncbi:TetR/AcrR family transcriptional regulator [Amycolatopsis sp. NPDC059027]|uniref:TetR/AcrR family transcriptional regulator n=1 Tax=unclassified Amycolatopsis TaxID=2618356 RepID=UPI00366D1DB0
MQPAEQNNRERFLDAALAVLLDRGPTALTIRGVAEAAGASTIAVYTRFGGRSGLYDALYERTFDLLREMLETLPPETEDGLGDLLGLAMEFRKFAWESPARYALMFERPLPDFNPDPGLRAVVLRTTFELFIGKVRRVSPPGIDARAAGYQLWATMHGLMSMELTLRSRAAVSGWFIPPTDEAYEEVYRSGVQSMITGLGLRNLAGA